MDFGTQNRSKKGSKIRCDFGWILEGSWSGFGAILERFWAQVGGQVGAKLGPKSEKWRSQDDVKKYVVKVSRRCTQVYSGVRRVTPAEGGGSL